MKAAFFREGKEVWRQVLPFERDIWEVPVHRFRERDEPYDPNAQVILQIEVFRARPDTCRCCGVREFHSQNPWVMSGKRAA